MGLMPELRLENNGDAINISSTDPGDFLRETGATGFGVAPTEVTFIDGADDGAHFRYSKRGARDITLPLAVEGANRTDVEQKLRRLTRLLNPKNSTPRMFVHYPDGTELWSEVVYVSGADHQYGQDTNGRTYCRWVITLRSPSPYWTSVTPVSYQLRAPNQGRGLIKTGHSLSFMRVSSSQAIGSVQINNPGDVEAPLVIIVTGPGSSFSASSQFSPGFTYNAAITHANPVTFDTDSKTVLDSAGVNLYANLGTAPKLFTLPVGESVVTAALLDSDPTSLISISFSPLYEVVF